MMMMMIIGQVPHVPAGHRDLRPGEGPGLAGPPLHRRHLPAGSPRLPGPLRPALRDLAVRGQPLHQVQGQKGRSGGGGGGVAT